VSILGEKVGGGHKRDRVVGAITTPSTTNILEHAEDARRGKSVRKTGEHGMSGYWPGGGGINRTKKVLLFGEGRKRGVGFFVKVILPEEGSHEFLRGPDGERKKGPI